MGQCSRALLLRLTVAICVHLPEDLVCALLWCGLIFGHLHHRGNHLVDSLSRAKARGRHFRRKEGTEHKGQRSPSLSTRVSLGGNRGKGHSCICSPKMQ